MLSTLREGVEPSCDALNGVLHQCKVENGKWKVVSSPLRGRGKNFLATKELRNSGEGSSSQLKVENKKWKKYYLPLAPCGRGCHVVTGEGYLSQLKVESGKWKVISSPDGYTSATPHLESVAHYIRTASFFPNRGRKTTLHRVKSVRKVVQKPALPILACPIQARKEV